MKPTKPIILLVVCTMALGFAASLLFAGRPTLAEEVGDGKPVDVAALKAEVDRLKGLVPDQAHAMADVDFHASNLYFAGHNENWDLAQFYLGEVKSHLKWAVRIIPVRKNPKGTEVYLEQLLGVVEGGQLEPVKKSIEAKDKAQFDKTYADLLNGCYMCHSAVGKPYLRLHIPETPASRMIDFTPPK